MKLSPNFTLNEFLRSKTADKLGIDNSHYTPQQLRCMKALCNVVLEAIRGKVREIYPDALVVVTSGLRCPALNQEVKGQPNSQHLRGQAADIKVTNRAGVQIMTPQRLFDFVLSEGIVYDQVIQEFGEWCHISYNPTRGSHQRHAAFYAYRNRRGKTIFSDYPPPVSKVIADFTPT